MYLLADPEHVKGFAFAPLPRRFHLRILRIILDLQAIVGGYVRGQVLASLLMICFVVLLVVSTPAPLALAVFAHIYRQSLRLSLLVVVVSLLIGGQLLGIVGGLLALTIAASFRVLAEQLRIDLLEKRDDAACLIEHSEFKRSNI